MTHAERRRSYYEPPVRGHIKRIRYRRENSYRISSKWRVARQVDEYAAMACSHLHRRCVEFTNEFSVDAFWNGSTSTKATVSTISRRYGIRISHGGVKWDGTYTAFWGLVKVSARKTRAGISRSELQILWRTGRNDIYDRPRYGMDGCWITACSFRTSALQRGAKGSIHVRKPPEAIMMWLRNTWAARDTTRSLRHESWIRRYRGCRKYPRDGA